MRTLWLEATCFQHFNKKHPYSVCAYADRKKHSGPLVVRHGGLARGDSVTAGAKAKATERSLGFGRDDARGKGQKKGG
jgi:hypothetical protein